MRTAFPEPVLTITPAAVRDLQGREALSGLWTLFTKCKESLQDGRRLENISWRLWYREIMRDSSSSPVSPDALSDPDSDDSASDDGSSSDSNNEKDYPEKENNQEEVPQSGMRQPMLPAPALALAPTLSTPKSTPASFPMMPTPQSPPPTYVFGLEGHEQGSPVSTSKSAVSQMKHTAHPLTPTASQTSVDESSEASQVTPALIPPSPASTASIAQAPSIPQPSTESKSSPSIPASTPGPSHPHSQTQTEKRPPLGPTSSFSSVLSSTSTASMAPSSNSNSDSRPRRPSHRRRRSSFVNGTEEEPVNVGLIICEMLPAGGLDATEKTPMHIPFSTPSLAYSSPASSFASSNQQSTPTQPGAALAFADMAAAASTLPTPEIEVDEDDTLPAPPPRAGGARYPLVVPSPQTSPPRPNAAQQQPHGGQSMPPVIPPIVAPGGVQPPQLVIVTPTPGATPHPTPPATPLVGFGMSGRMIYGQYLGVPKARGQGRAKGKDVEGDEDVGSSEDDDVDEDDEDDYSDDYEDDDEEVDMTMQAASLSPSSDTGTAYAGAGHAEKRASILSAVSDRSTTSNASSNTTQTTSTAETRDMDDSTQPAEPAKDKGKQKETPPPDVESGEEHGGYNQPGYGELDDEDEILADIEAEFERSLQGAYPDGAAYEQEQQPTLGGSSGASSTAPTKGDFTEERPEQVQVQSSKPLVSAHTAKRRPPAVITARSGKGLRGGFTAGKGKSSSRSRSRHRDEVQKLASTLVMTASGAVVDSPPPRDLELRAAKLEPAVPTPSPVKPAAPVLQPPASTAVALPQPLTGQAAASPPPPSPTYSIQSSSSNGRGRSRNIVAIGRGAGAKGKRRGGNFVAMKRRLSGDGRKAVRGPKVAGDEEEEEEDEEAREEDGVEDRREEGRGGGKETSIEMDADDMLDEQVNPQGKVARSESSASIQQQYVNVSSDTPATPLDPAAVQAHIQAEIQLQPAPQSEPVPTAELRAPVRFNIGSNSEDGTGSASGSGSASMGRSGSGGFRSGSASGSRTRGGILKKRLERARARAVSGSVEEEREGVDVCERTSDQSGLRAEVGDTSSVQQSQVQETHTQTASNVIAQQQQVVQQQVGRPLLQPVGNRKEGRQLEELLKMEHRTHQLVSRQASTAAVGGLPPVIAPLAPSPRPNARSPSQSRGKSPRTKSAIAQRANATRRSSSTSRNLQDPHLMKVLHHVMDLPANGNRMKKVVLATSESEIGDDDDDDEDYETETDVDEAGLVAALSPVQQQAFADQMAAMNAPPEVAKVPEDEDDDQWASEEDEEDEEHAVLPSRPRSRARQRPSQSGQARPPALQRTYSSHYPAGRTGRTVKQQIAEQQRQQQQLQQLQQQQQQQLQQRNGKTIRSTIEFNRLPSESFQNLAKLRNNSIGGLTRLLNPGLNEEELLFTVQRVHSSGDMLKESQSPMRREATGGTIGGMHALRPLTAANPSMPPIHPPGPMAAQHLSNWNNFGPPLGHMNAPPPAQHYATSRPPLMRRHTENGPGAAPGNMPLTDARDGMVTSTIVEPAPLPVVPAVNHEFIAAPVAPVAHAPSPVALAAASVAPAAEPIASDIAAKASSPPVVPAPSISKSRSLAGIGHQQHRRQSSSSTTSAALRPNRLLTKLTTSKSFIAPASTTVTVNSLASDRASPAEINPQSDNSLYSKVPPDATSRIRALNAIFNSRKPTPANAAKSPPTASPIATSSSAPPDAVMPDVPSPEEPQTSAPAPSARPPLQESVTAPNGANVAVGLNGYGNMGRYQKKGPPADVEFETEVEDNDEVYEYEGSDDSESITDLQTERQKQIAASLACSLSKEPVLDEPLPPPRAPVNPQGLGAQRRAASGGRRTSTTNVMGAAPHGNVAQHQAVVSGDGPQQRRLPKTLQFTQMVPQDQVQPPSRHASRLALQQQQQQYPVQHQFQHDPQVPLQLQQQDYMQLQRQLEDEHVRQQREQLRLHQQLQQLQQQQAQQQQQQQHLQQQQQFLQQAYMHQQHGQHQGVPPSQHFPPHPARLPQQPFGQPSRVPIPYTQSQQHFPTNSLQRLGFPYNLPVTAIPSTPRTTRRTMLSGEISESVRQGIIVGRKITRLNPGLPSMGDIAERRRPLTAAPSMVQLLPKGTLKAMGLEEDKPSGSKSKGLPSDPDPAMRRALQHSRNKSWADTTHTSGW